MDKNNTQQKPIQQKLHEKFLFLLIEKQNLTDNRNLSGLPNDDLKYTINQVLTFMSH